MTDARTGSGRRPIGGDEDPGGELTPGRAEKTTGRDDTSVSGAAPGREEPEHAGAPDTSGQAVPPAGAGPGRERDAGPDGPLMPTEECGRLERRLRHAVTEFVDEPRTAVEEADRAVAEIAARFTDAVDRRRRALRSAWQSTAADHSGAGDTEQLRLALRDYRDLADQLLHL
ncbi:hypothetical protein [Streptomyces sp. NPDC101234]|uniref:hypothetical protein n=1 Tax=Streptomyces sp. NPDC101234 TaxID=3366138 RepID=UPI003808906C